MTTRFPRVNPAAAILIRPFQQFFRLEASSGILLLLAAVVALAWANSPLAPGYFRLWESRVTVDVGAFAISKPLLLWINDGLMAVFFFVVGLEIKREVLVGELSQPKKAALPIAAALGGALLPAALYAFLNAGGPGADGWAIPMATDIAFALGVLALLGRRVPLALKIFVTAVAIVDDLGAVLVIAIFYTAEVSTSALLTAGGFLVALVILNRTGVRRTLPYVIFGIALWVAVLKSGMHATIAGVLIALTIPARRVIDAPEFLRRAELLLAEFREDLKPGEAEPTADQRHALHSLEVAAERLETPLQRLEHALHPWVAFFIIPVFALANAGVAIGDDIGSTLTSPTTLGIIVGLFFGKQVGILALAWVATRTGIAEMPAGVRWRQIWGVGLLCGIGFTMSLFIGGLAFEDPALLGASKVGILAGSLLSGIVGALVLIRSAPVADEEPVLA